MYQVKCLWTGRIILSTTDKEQARIRAGSHKMLGIFKNGLHIG